MSKTMTRNRVTNFLPNGWSDVDNLLGNFFQNQEPRCCSTPAAAASLWEDADAFHLEVDLPGVAREDVEITFEKNELRVVAERQAFETERDGLVEERHYGKVERSVRLPETADAESIDAKLADGVLHVAVAKQPEAQPKRIEIQ